MTEERGVRILEGDDMSFRHVEGIGYVRPAVVKQLVKEELVHRGVLPSRRQRRRLEKLARAKLKPKVKAPGPPIQVRPRLSDRETTDRVAALLLDEYDKHRITFPATTLAMFLDQRAGEEVEKAWRNGQPIDRATVREGIGKLWDHAQRQQKGARR